MMYRVDVVLSIRPEYAEAILDGSKRWEFRRRYVGRHNRFRAYLYATSPVKAIVGWADVKPLWASLPEIWEMGKDAAGITEERFAKYFSGQSSGCVLKVLDSYRYRKPRPLNLLDVEHAPQSWCYVGVNVEREMVDVWVP